MIARRVVQFMHEEFLRLGNHQEHQTQSEEIIHLSAVRWKSALSRANKFLLASEQEFLVTIAIQSATIYHAICACARLRFTINPAVHPDSTARPPSFSLGITERLKGLTVFSVGQAS